MLGYEFQQQVAIGTYVVDFLIGEDWVVEAYGWSHEKLNKEHDVVREAWLREQGYRVTVLWWTSPHLWWQEFIQQG